MLILCRVNIGEKVRFNICIVLEMKKLYQDIPNRSCFLRADLIRSDFILN